MLISRVGIVAAAIVIAAGLASFLPIEASRTASYQATVEFSPASIDRGCARKDFVDFVARMVASI